MLKTAATLFAVLAFVQPSMAIEKMTCTPEEAQEFMKMREGKWSGVITLSSGNEVKFARTGRMSSGGLIQNTKSADGVESTLLFSYDRYNRQIRALQASSNGGSFRMTIGKDSKGKWILKGQASTSQGKQQSALGQFEHQKGKIGFRADLFSNGTVDGELKVVYRRVEKITASDLFALISNAKLGAVSQPVKGLLTSQAKSSGTWTGTITVEDRVFKMSEFRPEVRAPTSKISESRPTRALLLSFPPELQKRLQRSGFKRILIGKHLSVHEHFTSFGIDLYGKPLIWLDDCEAIADGSKLSCTARVLFAKWNVANQAKAVGTINLEFSRNVLSGTLTGKDIPNISFALERVVQSSSKSD